VVGRRQGVGRRGAGQQGHMAYGIIRTQAYAHIHRHTHAQTSVCAHTHIHTHKQVYVHTHTHTHIHKCMCPHTHTHIHKCMCTHTHTHTAVADRRLTRFSKLRYFQYFYKKVQKIRNFLHLCSYTSVDIIPLLFIQLYRMNLAPVYIYTYQYTSIHTSIPVLYISSGLIYYRKCTYVL
jgi:hypothetical protein